jgi:DNA-binding beta-propeller fold protein YncE
VRRVALVLVLVASALSAAVPSAAAATASHPFLFTLEGGSEGSLGFPIPPPEGEFEDACGVAVDFAGDIYVSDYFHRAIDVFNFLGEYVTQIQDPDPDGPCNLAVDQEGNVYVNNWRRDVVRFAPSEFPPTEATAYGAPTVLDFPTAPGARSTGVFLDPESGDLYVDDRTYVAVYGAATLGETEPEPTKTIGLGVLGSGYGVAVSDFPATQGDVYVPDAATGTVRVFDSTGLQTGELEGAGTPQHGFESLLDSDVAIDQGDGHVFVADDTEPGLESPAAVVDEFNAPGEYRGQLPHAIADAQPSAIAMAGGDVLVTSGNSEAAVVFGFGPTEPAHRLAVKLQGAGEGRVVSEPAGISCGTACAAEYDVGQEVILTAIPASGSAFTAWTGCDHSTGGRCKVVLGSDRTVSAEFEPAAAAAPPSAAPAVAAAAIPTAPASAPAPTRRRRPCRRHRPCSHAGSRTHRGHR